MLRTRLAIALLLLSSGCVSTLHFRSAQSPSAPLPSNCAPIERCNYRDARTQARCEMVETSLPATAALVECTELGLEG